MNRHRIVLRLGVKKWPCPQNRPLMNFQYHDYYQSYTATLDGLIKEFWDDNFCASYDLHKMKANSFVLGRENVRGSEKVRY